MNRHIFATSFLVSLLWASLTTTITSAQTSIAGDWDVTIQSAQGTNSMLVTFKQDGDKISGLLKSPMGELPFPRSRAKRSSGRSAKATGRPSGLRHRLPPPQPQARRLLQVLRRRRPPLREARPLRAAPPLPPSD